MKYSLVSILSFLAALFAIDSDPEYQINLKSGSFTPDATFNFEAVLTSEKTSKNSSHLYRIIQFTDIPNKEEKRLIEKAGIELLSYIPNRAYYARIPVSTSHELLSTLPIRSILKIEEEFKTAEILKGEKLPEWTIIDSKVNLKVKIFSSEERSQAETHFKSIGVQVKKYLEETQTFYLATEEDNIKSISSYSFVQWIEPVDTRTVQDDDRSSRSTRSNVLNSKSLLGRKYDGSGVSVVLSDNGMIGPHIDFEGRVTHHTDENTGNHGDMTAGLLVGAGNLDPRNAGIAPGADIHIYKQGNLIFIDSYQHYLEAVENYNSDGIVITSTSYSQGQGGIYTSDTEFADNQVNEIPQIFHFLSAGNSGTFDHGYGAGPGWANISGGIKAGKNVMCLGNIDENNNLFSTSSRGPAADGRIKPDLCARGQRITSTDENNTYQQGAGTSASTPIIAGVAAQLYNAYRDLNTGMDPESGLIKGTMLNTARDLGNPGPDYRYGWGKVNALRAVRILEEKQYQQGSIDQGESQTHFITVPANVAQLKVMTYWTDEAGNPASAKALVNDINMQLRTTGGELYDPWVLDPTPNATNLNSDATRGIDDLNNMEQVTLNQPEAGTYEVILNGHTIPMGPQSYYVIYDFVLDEIELTSPIGGEQLVAGENETIHWDAPESDESFTLELSNDNGATYSTISNNINPDRRFFDWTVPNTISVNSIIKLTRGSQTSLSAEPFNIMNVPSNLAIASVCPNSITLEWGEVAEADAYQVWMLGEKYMEPIGTTSEKTFEVTGLNPNEEHWFSVSTVISGTVGQRAIALRQEPGTQNCILDKDVELTQVVSPTEGTIPNCIDLSNKGVTLLIENIGIESSNGLMVFYQLNNGAVVSDDISQTILPGETISFEFDQLIDLTTPGSYALKSWIQNSEDQNLFNDTIEIEILVVQGQTESLPHSQMFNSFATCESMWTTCDRVCGLTNGYINLDNGVGDDIDWRVRSGQTPSFSFVDTGVSGDYDQNGNGQYLYLESIENCHQKTGSMMTPCIDLTTTECPVLEFAYSMYGATMGELHVDLVTPQGTIVDVMPPIVGNQGLGWKIATVDLSEYADDIVNVIITGVTGNGSSSVMAIDAISIIDSAPCSTNTSDITDLGNVRIFPNPNNGAFQIELPNTLLNKELSFRIYDPLGRQLKSFQNFGSKVIYVDDLAIDEGLIILEVTYGENVEIKKIFKSKL